MEISDQGVDEQAHADISDHPKAILGRLSHVTRQSGTVAQLDRWRIERLVGPVSSKRHAEDQENRLRRVEESIRMGGAGILRCCRKTQGPARQQYQGYSLEHVPLPVIGNVLLCSSPSLGGAYLH